MGMNIYLYMAIVIIIVKLNIDDSNDDNMMFVGQFEK